ncbi:kinesin K39, putative, partial [Trypanosoma vivax Y486]
MISMPNAVASWIKSRTPSPTFYNPCDVLPPNTEAESVKVAVRVRPFLERELTSSLPTIVIVHYEKNTVTICETQPREMNQKISHKTFQFDSVFSSFGCPDRFGRVAGGQLEVYEVIGRPLVLNAFKGYNSCLFAYGQTGSGKTYTMMGGDTNSLDGDDSGVMPRLCRELFETLARVEAEGHSRWRVLVGYVEVYNERVSDLLAKRRRGAKEDVFVDVREHPTRGVFIEGQQLPEVSTVREVLDLVEVGNGIRHTAATKMNERSSRSHAIFMFLLHEERSMQTATGQAITTAGMNSRINLVDLAGSERVAQSEVVGQRFNETRYINLSLTTLGRVIDMLAEMATNKNSQWSTPPYRDSKLTYILKDSFGGNSKTFMIATVSPSALNYEETLSTLRYASRARDIVNVTRVNEDPRARRIRELEEQIVRMRCDIEGKDPSYVAGLEEKLVLLEAEAQKRAADLQALEKEREKNEIHERMLRATEAMREQLAVKAGELQLQVEFSKQQQAVLMSRYHEKLKSAHTLREKELREQEKRHKADLLNCQKEWQLSVEREMKSSLNLSALCSMYLLQLKEMETRYSEFADFINSYSDLVLEALFSSGSCAGALDSFAVSRDMEESFAAKMRECALLAVAVEEAEERLAKVDAENSNLIAEVRRLTTKLVSFEEDLVKAINGSASSMLDLEGIKLEHALTQKNNTSFQQELYHLQQRLSPQSITTRHVKQFPEEEWPTNVESSLHGLEDVIKADIGAACMLPYHSVSNFRFLPQGNACEFDVTHPELISCERIDGNLADHTYNITWNLYNLRCAEKTMHHNATREIAELQRQIHQHKCTITALEEEKRIIKREQQQFQQKVKERDEQRSKEEQLLRRQNENLEKRIKEKEAYNELLQNKSNYMQKEIQDTQEEITEIMKTLCDERT